MSSLRAVRVMVCGQVQGVGYRAWCAAAARAAGLGGWVRNRRNGDVEAVFIGPASRVGAMVEACRQGPGRARVDAVTLDEADPTMARHSGIGDTFAVLETV